MVPGESGEAVMILVSVTNILCRRLLSVDCVQLLSILHGERERIREKEV